MNEKFHQNFVDSKYVNYKKDTKKFNSRVGKIWIDFQAHSGNSVNLEGELDELTDEHVTMHFV